MVLQIGFTRECLGTMVTGEGSLACVYPLMNLSIGSSSESPLTDGTGIGPDGHVYPLVFHQITASAESLATILTGAGVGPVSSVDPQVGSVAVTRCELLSTSLMIA